MSDTVVHNLRVSFDETDERVRDFVKYLKSEKGKEEMIKYYTQASSSSDKKTYINDLEGNEFTLIHNGGYNCLLVLRGM